MKFLLHPFKFSSFASIRSQIVSSHAVWLIPQGRNFGASPGKLLAMGEATQALGVG